MSETVHRVPDGFGARIGPRELAELNALADAQPDRFWLDQAKRLTWNKSPTEAGDWSFDEDTFGIRWFADGELNLSVNCLDRHLPEHATPIVVETDPATCSVQFDPVGTAKFVSACDISKSILVTRGISFGTQPSADGLTRVVVGTEAVPIQGGEGLAGPDLKALKTKTGDAIAAELEAAGYPKTADPAKANMLVPIQDVGNFPQCLTAVNSP